MSPWPKRFRPALAAIALLFAASTLLYSILWMIAVRWLPEVELGFDTASGRGLRVASVRKGSPAEKAGLLAGDRVLAIDGARIENVVSMHRAYRSYKPGDTVQVSIERSGVPMILTGVFRRRLGASTSVRKLRRHARLSVGNWRTGSPV
jgi:predicted metalloprotease with PDZ domain